VCLSRIPRRSIMRHPNRTQHRSIMLRPSRMQHRNTVRRLSRMQRLRSTPRRRSTLRRGLRATAVVGMKTVTGTEGKRAT